MSSTVSVCEDGNIFLLMSPESSFTALRDRGEVIMDYGKSRLQLQGFPHRKHSKYLCLIFSVKHVYEKSLCENYENISF
jgi:hypothetical protein